MRTHLLRTFYAAITIEPDIGCAANDGDCESSEEPPAPRSAKALTLVRNDAQPAATDQHDDYYLGGYAGI